MNKIFINNETLYSILLILFSFFFNYYYANLGVHPIDTFAFFDNAYNILIGRHPFKDIWITTGPLVDYMQALSFKLFGLTWTSYIIHASILNAFITYIFFKTLLNFNLNKSLSFIYAAGFGMLCYTISGTPFAYIHSYVFSLLSILFFFNAIKLNNKKSYFFLPTLMVLSFFSQQNPSALINFFILIFLAIFFIKKKDTKNLIIFIRGSIFSLILVFIFFYFTKIPFQNFIQQYFLFPLTLGENRVLGNEMAHIKLLDRLTFRNVIGHFKFINIYLIILIYLNVKDFINKKIIIENFLLNLSLIFFCISFIFNQLITSNQTYIFSFIPFIAAFTHINLIKRKSSYKYQVLILLLCVTSIFKYHFEYNEKRKFMDLQSVNLKKAQDAEMIDEKLKGLKWITPKFKNNAAYEMQLLKDTLKILKDDKKSKMVITDYQFFSILLEENLNTPNRWYTNDNNSYPLQNHKYFKFYKKHIEEIVSNNNIEVVYTIGMPKFKNIVIYINEICNTNVKINAITDIYYLKKC